MTQVYRHRPFATDQLLGRVEADGKTYETHLGPDKYVGRVEIDSGKIYAARLGPDKHAGRVELDSGKVYRARFGPDEYLGRVDGDGKFYRHKPLAPDQYVGRVETLYSLAHGGAAFLLLVWPAVEEQEAEEGVGENRDGRG
ncbi:MAG: hypothetical protein HY784_01550 [Chloroflexi bacterium]|nr:hypothetical protein [Chloroflexota bacterium]